MPILGPLIKLNQCYFKKYTHGTIKVFIFFNMSHLHLISYEYGCNA